MDKHIAFVSMPAFGHVNPSLPLVEELVSRGYRITYATGERFLPIVEAAGARGIPLNLSGMPARPPSGDEFTVDALVPMMEKFLREVRETFPPMLAHFEQDVPSAVCYDLTTFPGRMLADKLGVLDVSLIPYLASNEKFGLQDLMKHDSFAPDNPKLMEYGKKIGMFAAEYGLDLAPQAYGGDAATLNLVLVAKELQIAAESFDDRFVFLGPQLGRRLENEHWTPPADGKPVMLITLGTIWSENAAFFRTCVEAFGDSEWHVVMAIGERTDPDEVGPTPENFEVFRFVPQLAVLRHARIFVSHAGMNGVMEALSFGVPIVGAPQQPEQDTNGRRVEELGLGRSLGMRAPDAETLRAAVRDVDGSAEIRANAARMQKTFEAYEGARVGADAIEAGLARKSG
ncbi:macrolide family glycosyltransferase [Micromonospora sp. CA-259024]|uniref:macrolide family glycosyltransferase n=1 Tax=Micromonospora sp. CA-259024 TaxID=3239965 RepID=UPI003D90C4DF